MALLYSCCFWFSLRLGGIFIALFSLFQGVTFLVGCCLAYMHSDMVKNEFTTWINNLNIVYGNEYLDTVLEDPKMYISLAIAGCCIYVISCIIFIYGAYIYNNILMLSFIILELVRLILISAVVATGLLLLKQNTMDIGSLIGASVVGGFFLLGMFYLWVCAANLPILINEMERDDQAAEIAKLQQLLKTQGSKRSDENIHSPVSNETLLARGVFVVPNKSRVLERSVVHRSKIPILY